MAGTRSERSAPSALLRWMVRCTVLAGLLLGGWLIGSATAVADPLDPEIPLETGNAPLPAPGPQAADQLGAVVPPGPGGDAPAVLDTLTGSTGSAESVVRVAERIPLSEVAGLPETVDTLTQITPIAQVTKPLIPTPGSDEGRPEAVDSPLSQKGEPAPVSDPAPVPPGLRSVSMPVMSGPVAVTTVPYAPVAVQATAAHPGSVRDGHPTPSPDGPRSTPPCSAGSSSGSGSASGPVAVGEVAAGLTPAALGRKPGLTAIIRPGGLPQRPSTSPD
ncbi:MAG: hypothetical protein M3308_03275 [Actinomycetota bacterium]|nr:hypothetical protein [Actinomycetota bacterium]